MLGDELVKRIWVKPIIVAGHGHSDRARQRETLKRSEVGRLLHEHPVPRLQQHPGYERQCLLRAAGDEQVLRLGIEPARRQPLRDHRA